MSKFHGDIGTINSPNFALGYIIAIYTNVPTSTLYLGQVYTNGAQIKVDPVTTNDSEAVSSSLEVDFSGSVSKEVEAGLRAIVEDDSRLVISNYYATYFQFPFSVLEAPTNANLVALMAKTKKEGINGQNAQFIFIDRMINADSVYLAANSATTVSNGVNVLKFGEYTLNVKYTCTNTLTRTHPSGAFFKYDTVFVTESGSVLPDGSGPQNLSAYSFTATAPSAAQ